eukprot:scaffold23362_cov86-Skeletonema_dohrnii-CCMP3373.AAC.1
MRSITKTPILRRAIWGTPTIALDHQTAVLHKNTSLVVVHLTMIIAHFPDDDMCRRKSGGS